MIFIGIVYGSINGNIADVSNAIIDSSKEAITLCITMLGVMSFWMGLMEIAMKAGIINSISKRMKPIMRMLFPELPMNHPAYQNIIMNLIANILGLGWAATPAGLSAMKELDVLEEERRMGKMPGPIRKRGVASNEMCTFLIINISSLQLIPVNVIAYRSQYGSINPVGIVGAGIVATSISTMIAFLYCRKKNKKT